MNVWSLGIVIVLALMTFALALLVVRVVEHRNAQIANVALQAKTGEEALVVLNANTQMELAKARYAEQQAVFAQRVLDLYEAGKFADPKGEIAAAVIRQLDGVAPPRGTPAMAIREPRPRAEWPEFGAYTVEERTL